MSSWTNITPYITRRQKLYGYWTLLTSLVKRDIRARYRRTILGPLWAIIPAVMTMVIFSFLRGVVDIDSAGVPYIVFAFSTIVPWTYFQKALSNVPNSVIGNGGLLRKMAIPRDIFPLIGIFTAFFDFLMSLIVLIVILILYGIPITIAWLWLPILLLLLSVLAWAVGLGITALSVYRRDLLQGLPYILQLWFFITPVVYSIDAIRGDLRLIYSLNPAVGLIDGFRQVFVFGQPPDIQLLTIGTLVTILCLLIAYPIFRLSSPYFADVL